MQATILANGKPVLLELTKEQVDKISKASQPIFERVKTMEDVFREAGENPADYEISENATERQISRIRHARVDLIIEVLNEGQKLVLTDNWFRLWYNRPTDGKGWTLGNVYYNCTGSDVSSRLCFKDRETALHADEYFANEITDYLENKGL